MRVLLAFLCFFVISEEFAAAGFMPENDLHLEDSLTADSNVSEEQFHAIIDDVVDLYGPIVAAHGGRLHAAKLWENSTVNAMANRQGGKWMIHMYGGLARRPEVTPDGFALVVCHELGHHVAGYPKKFFFLWASNEGQSDYFATQACARKIWANDIETNATYRALIDPLSKEWCDQVWQTEYDQDLCYRVVEAGKSLGHLLAALRNSDQPSVETPDSTEVRKTSASHPNAQCRLDTYVAGALCPVEFPDGVIPGQSSWGKRAERQAIQYSCSIGLEEQSSGVRPRCWFKPLTY